MCVRAMMMECGGTEAVALHTIMGKLSHIGMSQFHLHEGRGSLEELDCTKSSKISKMDGDFWGQAPSWKCQWEEDLEVELVPMPVITEKNSDCN